MEKDNNIFENTIDDRIDAFIRGMMTEEEEAAFKQEIKANPELRKYVLANISLIKGIREKDSQEEKTIIRNNTKDRVRTLLWWACSAAAAFALYYGYSQDKKFDELNAIVSPYYTEYKMSNYSRGDLDSATVAHLYTLFNNIQTQRSVSKVIDELEPIYASIDSDFTYNAFANDIAINLAFAYIKDNQKDKAITILEKLEKNNPDAPIAQTAKKLLEALRKK